MKAGYLRVDNEMIRTESKQSVAIEWPAFVGYCICTAGTVHVHGSHYTGGREGEVFSASADFLSREMQQLSELRYAWSLVQHQRDTLQTIYACHSELAQSLAAGNSSSRYSPVLFHLEDFFDRYAAVGLGRASFDGAHVSFADVLLASLSQERYTGHDLYHHPSRGSNASMSSRMEQQQQQQQHHPSQLPSSKDKPSASRKKRLDLKLLAQHRPSSSSHPDPPLSASTATLVLSSPIDNNNNNTTTTLSATTHQNLADMAHDPIPPQPPFSPPPPLPHTFPSLHSNHHNHHHQNQQHHTNPHNHQQQQQQQQQQDPTSYDPMFGLSPRLPFTYPPYLIHTHNINNINNGHNTNADLTTTSPSASTGTDEREDPFLNLLEQLAENENELELELDLEQDKENYT
ncbi:uncharacterized protein L3040_005795 [Drepanopeziza brunnea f. sp. 'multigermtubi']|uniref:uncharacterized protein n=1 Tax=Drepanopeziza brunnea f. sp. 'multigermtubi' TaxID=698441 RepID=UPI00239C5AA4|nr:hypothetical protein L3040_005795 [Drepanopeziza brunnea f. sp. 'multigermtubi']